MYLFVCMIWKNLIASFGYKWRLFDSLDANHLSFSFLPLNLHVWQKWWNGFCFSMRNRHLFGIAKEFFFNKSLPIVQFLKFVKWMLCLNLHFDWCVLVSSWNKFVMTSLLTFAKQFGHISFYIHLTGCAQTQSVVMHFRLCEYRILLPVTFFH